MKKNTCCTYQRYCELVDLLPDGETYIFTKDARAWLDSLKEDSNALWPGKQRPSKDEKEKETWEGARFDYGSEVSVAFAKPQKPNMNDFAPEKPVTTCTIRTRCSQLRPELVGEACCGVVGTPRTEVRKERKCEPRNPWLEHI